MDYQVLLAATLLATGGAMAVGYESFSRGRWPVGQLYRVGKPLSMVSLGIVALLAGLLGATLHNPWWAALVLLVPVPLFTLWLTQAFKVYAQAVAPLLMLGSTLALWYVA